jgi:Uri superfamily endonuclease
LLKLDGTLDNYPSNENVAIMFHHQHIDYYLLLLLLVEVNESRSIRRLEEEESAHQCSEISSFGTSDSWLL